MDEALQWLLAALVLAVAQVMLAAGAKRRQDGYAWAAGSRDAHRSYTGIAARLDRAQSNLFETLWVFAVAVLITKVAGRQDGLGLWGERVYVVARLVYVPLYAAGVAWWRSVAFMVSMAGLVMVLIPLF